MFFLIFLSIYFLGYIYIAWRINSGLNLSAPYNWIIYIALVLLGILSIIAFTGSRFGMPGISVIGPLGYICMGLWGIFITFFIFNDIVNIANFFLKIEKFRYYSTIITLIISALASVWALCNVAFILNVKEINIKVADLKVEKLKIVQMTDLHINAFTSQKNIQKVFDKVMKLNPDLIVIAGDVIDVDINKDDKFLEYGFGKLKAPYGVFAVTGNHEYYTGLQAFKEMCVKLGIKVLDNESVLIKDTIYIAGINDVDRNNAENIGKSLNNASNKYPIIFLSHQPDSFDIASAQGKNILQLSGHTHAGQIPPIEIVRSFMKYNYGLYKNNDSIMYVTSGTRWWGPPMRFANTSEIVVINLHR